MKKLIPTLAFISLLIPGLADAGTYWVHPYGTAANYAACSSATDPGGTCVEGNCANYCARNTANAGAVAGDVVNLKGGTYTVAGSGLDWEGIDPANSGSEGNVITFQKATGETPVITGNATGIYGIWLSGDSYIKIDGITFQDVKTWAYVQSESHHNEVTNCTFTSTAGNEAGVGFMIFGDSTHNWIHANTFSKRISPSGPCAEGADLIRIGGAWSAGHTTENTNYNTIENNTLYSTAHTIIDNFGLYNVIRNNISHNEPWISTCTETYTTQLRLTSATELTIGTGSKTLTIDTGLAAMPTSTYYAATLVSRANKANAMNGTITSYNATTGELVINVAQAYQVSGSGTLSDWDVVINTNYPQYTTAGYAGLFGHRNFQISNDYARDGVFTLMEGNRLGHASSNPGNNGPSNLDIASHKNIVRYNDMFNGMAAGIFMKNNNADPDCGSKVGNSSCAGDNRVYNNTITGNGTGYNYPVYSAKNSSVTMLGIAQYNATGSGTVGNVIKNNIVYSNNQGDICAAGYKTGACTAEAYDTVSNNHLTAQGDPLFTDYDVSDPTSLTLPDLTLQAASGAKDAGTYLTQANGAGTSSTTLVVDDALYFQDGTWGSSLSDIQADWIKVGTVTVQISSINYATNTITLASAISWADNAEIRLYKKSDGTQVLYGSETDMGAHEYEGASSYTVTPSNTTGCTLYPATAQTTEGTAVALTVTTAYGYTSSVSGCGGTTSSGVFTTDTITADCTVTCTGLPKRGVLGGTGTVSLGGSGVALLGN